MQQKKPNQLKKCGVCQRLVPQIWKTLTINEVRTKCCQQCAAKAEKFKLKEKAEKAKIRRKIKRERITEKKLDQVTSKLVRSIYPSMCHGCGIQLEFNTMQAGHFCGRSRRSVRFSLKNLAPLCKNCNFYCQDHVYTLGKHLNSYWGEGTAEEQIRLGNQLFKPSQQFRDALYELYSNPPQGKTLEETRQLVFEQYLLIFNQN